MESPEGAESAGRVRIARARAGELLYMGFKDYLSVIIRRWMVFLPIAVTVIGAHVLWVTIGQQQLYRATSTISFPTAVTTGGQVAKLPLQPIDSFKESPVLEIATQLLAGKRPFTAKEFEEPARREAIESFVRTEGESNVPRLRDDMEDSVNISLAKDDHFATIEVLSPWPRRAVLYAWAIPEAARIYSRERLRQAVDTAAVELRAQIAKLEKERDVVARDKADFAKRTGCANFGRYQEMIQSTLIAIDGEIGQLRGQQRELERTIDDRVSKSQQGGDEIQAVALGLGENPRVKELSDQLLKARLEHDLETSRLTARHPTVAALKSKVDRLEKLIADEEETIVAEGLKKWNSATRDLVAQSGGLVLKLEVLKERKAALGRELLRLADFGQEYARLENEGNRVGSTIDRLQSQINDLTLEAAQAAGQVQIQALGTDAKPAEKRGVSAGALFMTAILAILFALGVVYVLEYIDTRMKSEQDVRRYLGLPIVGKIPNDRHNLLVNNSGRGEVAEKFHTAATLIRSTSRELGMKSFVVTSALPREGKTTVSVNLAVALAIKGAKVILVDADLRTPRLHDLFNLPNRTGLSTVLDCQVDPRRVIDGLLSDAPDSESTGAAEALVATDIENLSVLTGGPPPESPMHLLESDRMHRLLKELAGMADFLIFDTPPVNKVADALSIAGIADATIFVVGCGVCQSHDVAWAKHLLTNVQANLLGVFLNRAERPGRRDSYYTYYRASEAHKRVKVNA